MFVHLKRSDAQAHRALLLDAADEVFSDHSVHVALELATAQAGVSRATLYRNFPDRTALISALRTLIQAVTDKSEAFNGFSQ